MKQSYHSNAVTNDHIRTELCSSLLPASSLAERYDISTNTVYKWRKREKATDLNSRPHLIHYALTPLEKEIIISVRKATWAPLDDILDTVTPLMPKVKRSNLYATLLEKGINKVPQEKKREAKRFKEYAPGFLHVDVTYLPKLEGKRNYLFVAIDRATRTLYYALYHERTAKAAENFLYKCKEFFPFKISHILTDNGFEFTNKGMVSKRGNRCAKPSLLDNWCERKNVEHRLTRPCTPQTNGMVERANHTIKSHTVKVETYNTIDQMNDSLNKFLLNYLFQRRHSGLVKELKVKTPFEAIHEWYKIQPELFNFTPDTFQAKALKLLQQPIQT